MNIEQELRQALRRKPAPPDFTDRVMARIAEDAERDAPARLLRMTPKERLQTGAGRSGGRARWLAAVAATALLAAGAVQYYAHQQTIAEAERVQQDIQVALRITSEKLAAVQEKVERSARDAAR